MEHIETYLSQLDSSDIDRLLASLSRSPVKKGTQDYQDIVTTTSWYKLRYQVPTEATLD